MRIAKLIIFSYKNWTNKVFKNLLDSIIGS
jgi:hypothetical protein